MYLGCQLMVSKAARFICAMLLSLQSNNSDIAGDTATVTVPTKITQDKTNGDSIRKEQSKERTNEVVGPMSERGREMRGGTQERVCISRTIHHLGCFGEVEKHIAVMTELNCDGIPIR